MSQTLSPHFDRSEFETSGPMPDECVHSYQQLCVTILESVRAQFGKPIHVTSGFRSPSENLAAHGVSNSQHQATSLWCAADWYVEGMEKDMRPVFDWMRLSSGLDFDQLILEHGSSSDIIHTSWVAGLARREALEGATANQSAYKSWPVTPTDIVES